jgi:hypothetical protein
MFNKLTTADTNGKREVWIKHDGIVIDKIIIINITIIITIFLFYY